MKNLMLLFLLVSVAHADPKSDFEKRFFIDADGAIYCGDHYLQVDLATEKYLGYEFGQGRFDAVAVCGQGMDIEEIENR